MKRKKYILAIALFGGMLFTAQAADLININEQATTSIEKSKIRIPTHG